jgi:glycosyltransferase involved in cell wall biosynthesis
MNSIMRHILNPRSYLKAARKIISNFVVLNKTPEPKLYMTLLVKNEEDILEENLLFHKAMGVDGFIVTDNNSTDDTPVIIEKYVRKGWIKEVLVENDNNYAQAKWVNRMILIAKEKYGADWVINCDADELWYYPTQNLKDAVRDTWANVVFFPLYNVVPEKDKNIASWEFVVRNPIENHEQYGLSKYSVFNKQIPKVSHRTKGYRMIAAGNHGVEMTFSKVERREGCVYHYPTRSLSQFVSKVRIAGEALCNNPDERVCSHLRELYKIYIDNQIEKEYEKIVGEELLQLFIQKGIVERDSSIKDIMADIQKNKQ